MGDLTLVFVLVNGRGCHAAMHPLRCTVDCDNNRRGGFKIPRETEAEGEFNLMYLPVLDPLGIIYLS